MAQVDKQFFFMAGLPRSGGTLLSSILSQNPDIYVSPQSTLPNTLGAAYNQYQSKEHKDSNQFDSIYAVMESIIPTFYSVRPEKYIIDKNFSWLDGHPYVILENHLKNDIRVVCPVRDVLGILSSWNRLCENDPNNQYDNDIRKKYKDKTSMADKRARFFMELGDEENGILKGIENLKRVLYPEFKDNILLVDYDDLTNDTETSIRKIYEFLQIEHYTHTYTELSTPHKYEDFWGVKNHHVVKSTIAREDYDYSKIFSPETIKKYSGLEFWK
jgi:sulfotransferase